MSSINRATLAKEIDGVIEYIYPKTSADLVEYTDTDNTVMTVEDKLHSINTTTGSLDANFSNYYTKTQSNTLLDAKLDDTQLVTTAPSSSSTDTEISSAKAVYGAINTLSSNVNDNYYTKTEADTKFYVAITVNSVSLSKSLFEQGDSADTTTVTWNTNTLAVSAKVSVNNGSAVETISSGQANSGTYTATINTASVNSNGSALNIPVNVEVKDAFNATANKSVNATIANQIMYGSAAEYTTASAFFGSGSTLTKKLQASRTLSKTNVTVKNGQRLSIAVPVGYGTPSFSFNDTPTAAPKVASNVTTTNQFGKTVAYDIYQNNITVTSDTVYTLQIS